MQHKRYSQGFTLVEMMVVLAIIAILFTIALPGPNSSLTRAQVIESLALIDDFKKLSEEVYKLTGEFPTDNIKLGIPKAELLVGNFVTKIEVEQGAFQIHFGNKANEPLKDKILTVRPVVVKDSAESPPSWVCGYSKVPDAMRAIGDNKTSIEIKYLPVTCRI